MANTWHVNWLKEGVKPWNQRRKKIKFIPDLQGVNFYDILPEDYRDAPKASRFFEMINLSEANLNNSDLSNLNFKQAKFNNCNLSEANLDASNFEDAKFTGAILTGSSAKRAIFWGAIFTQSNLMNMDFDKADVRNTTFIETPLSENQMRDFGESGGIKTIATVAEYKKALRAEKNTVEFASRPLSPSRPDKNTKYDVFYGTNRKPIFTLGELVDYGHQSDTKINYGVCEVIIPESHEIGKLGSSLWGRLVKGSDDRLKIRQIIGLNPELYWSHINALLKKMKVKERPTIFIHGYNNTFKDAVLRSAQIGRDLGIGQGIGLFSWPSGGQRRLYAADETVSEVSKYPLANFIEEFIDKTEQKSINIIAHSMGCRCLLGAVEVLSNSKQSALQKIDQIILAAADVDARHMGVLGQHAVNNCKRTTSYVSAQDDALKISGWLHNYPRVGLVPPTYVLKGMDTVLVNQSDLGSLGHGYVASSRAVLNDIFSLLKTNADPADRHSVELVSSGTVEHWKIRE